MTLANRHAALAIALLLAIPLAGAAVAQQLATEADKAYWQEKYEAILTRLGNAKDAAAQSQVAYTRARTNDRYRGQYRQEIEAALEAASQELAAAQAQYDAFPEEARAAGVPPGWLREVEQRHPAAPAP